MKDTSIEHYCSCLSTRKCIFTFKESKEEDNFVFEIYRNNDSLVKYMVADNGYQTRQSAKEHFILSFLEHYLRQFTDDKTRSS